MRSQVKHSLAGSFEGKVCMSVIGNILWIFLGGGILLFLEYLFGGVILCITIIGIPFGIQCIKLCGLALLPFGKKIKTTETGHGIISTFLNVIWIVFAGLAISLTHVIFGLLCAVTIIGLPFAKQHLKLASLALTPFGHAYE
jgi:uncharacterized membrane protein YccF (DUF307 family)